MPSSPLPQPWALPGAHAEGADRADTPLRAEDELPRWQAMVGEVGRELAGPLTAALERVTTLTTTGRIDQAGLQALRDELNLARHAGLMCQQLARLASGRIRQSHERIHLTHTVQSVLSHRAREMHHRGVLLSQSLQAVEVQADASMLFALLNALVDWWLSCARGPVDLHIDTDGWPARARLHCTVPVLPADAPLSDEATRLAQAHNLRWALLEQTARAMGLPWSSRLQGQRLQLTLTFPHTISPLADFDEGPESSTFGDSINSRPLAGSHVLVVSHRRELRQQVRETLQGMGLVLDFCTSVKEAVQFCKQGLPHAIVFEGVLRNGLFERLMAHLRTEVPEFVFIELTPEGRQFEPASLHGHGIARVGCEGVAQALPSALVYELARQM